MAPIEGLLKKKNKTLRLTIDDKTFSVDKNQMHYEGFVNKKLDGSYLSIVADKEICDNVVCITLVKGITGFDYATGERYDRRLGRVSYKYDGEKVKLSTVQDENDIAFIEQQNRQNINDRVKQLKKKKNKKA
jgi:hypothetical protein